METLFSFLEKRVDDSSSLLCIGLDPYIPDLKEATAESALDFCLNIVEQTVPYAAAFKPNAAFFEIFGADGWAALKKLISTIHKESERIGSHIPVILDAKRGDIASTTEAYAKSAFEYLNVDSITLSPYLGKDSIEPFIQNQEKGIFLLCKTSNPGSGDFQDLILNNGVEGNLPASVALIKGRPPGMPLRLYEYVAHLAQQWNIKNNIGLVVGATHLDALASVRAIVPNMWFLSPGVGAQGGELELALRMGLRADSKGVLINVSRGISRAESPSKAAAELRDEMLEIRYKIFNQKVK